MFFTFVSYLCFGFALGPEFFKKDILKRIHVFADDIITVTATVLGGPAKPVVSATSVCVSGAPRIVLDWADDAATTTWDIDRDSLPLSTGIVLSQYVDTTVIANTTYNYVVKAFGPMAPGSNISDPISVTTSDCQGILPPATVAIERVGGMNVATHRLDIQMDRQRPQITGTTNIPNAFVDISLTRPQIQARIVANANGYFSWVPPIDLENGNHILSVTVIDPADTGRTATDGFVFRTEDGSDSGQKNRGKSFLRGGESEKPEEVHQSRIDFIVKVNNGAQFLFQGDEVNIATVSREEAFPVGAIFRSFIMDGSDKELFRLGESIIEASGRTQVSFLKNIPLSLDPGMYRIRVDALYREQVVSREVWVEIRAWPLLRLGGGTEVTYPEAASFIGTVSLALLSFFVLLLLLFVREYWLYLHHLRFVSERHLDRLGFIGPKRKRMVR